MDLQLPSNPPPHPRSPSPQTIHYSSSNRHHQLPFLVFTKQNVYVISFLLILLTTLIYTLIRPSSVLQLSPHQTSLLIHQSTCDYSNGKWVFDEDYIRMYTEDCPFLDQGFRCRQNGRRDEGFQKWRWQPHGCDLPRFSASDLLERSRNGRIVFVGDSIARNQWESMLCMLAQGVSNHSTIYEENGSSITKHKGFLSFSFQEYNMTVEYYRVPFIVRVSRPPPYSPPQVRGAIRVDKLHWFSNKWTGADVLIFSSGHWWSDDKTIKAGAYFQQGKTVNMTMDYMEAFSRSLKTWKSWSIQSLDSLRVHIFFRSFSSVHFRNGTWDQGGTCKESTAPETDSTRFQAEPLFNKLISGIVKELEAENRKVKYLNITYLSEFRVDGHPSIHREQGTTFPVSQDCSHWCLPGIPDTWNEILYAQLLLEGFKTKSK